MTWEDENALKIPASAVFRFGEDWAAFEVVRGRAQLTKLELGANNGSEAEILSGLDEGDRLILYPGSRIIDRARVKERTLD